MAVSKSENPQAIYIRNLVMALTIKELDARLLIRVGKRANRIPRGKATKKIVTAIVENLN